MLMIFSGCFSVGLFRSFHPRYRSIYGWSSYCLSYLWRKWSSSSFLQTATSRTPESSFPFGFLLYIANVTSAVATNYHDCWIYGSDVLFKSSICSCIQVLIDISWSFSTRPSADYSVKRVQPDTNIAYYVTPSFDTSRNNVLSVERDLLDYYYQQYEYACVLEIQNEKNVYMLCVLNQ